VHSPPSKDEPVEKVPLEEEPQDEGKLFWVLHSSSSNQGGETGFHKKIIGLNFKLWLEYSNKCP
jgi:hypothetical protein